MARTTPSPEDVLAFAKASKAENTVRAYAADWRDFCAYAQKRHKPCLPAEPDEVARYARDLVERRHLKLNTVSRRLAAITEEHLSNGYATPVAEWVVKNTLRRLRREHGAPARGKSPLLTKDLQRIVELILPTTAGIRDKAILLLGFAGAMRRRELVSLDIEDLAIAPEGLVLAINRSKTDQTRIGRKIGIPFGTHASTCPVRAVSAWLEAAKLSEGPLFRGVTKHGSIRPTRLTDQIVADIVKKHVRAIGKYAAKFSGHSLRVGFVTAAAMAGVSEKSIADQSGHQSLTVLRKYIRDASVFRNNAASKVGL